MVLSPGMLLSLCVLVSEIMLNNLQQTLTKKVNSSLPGMVELIVMSSDLFSFYLLVSAIFLHLQICSHLGS